MITLAIDKNYLGETKSVVSIFGYMRQEQFGNSKLKDTQVLKSMGIHIHIQYSHQTLNLWKKEFAPAAFRTCKASQAYMP